jgi:dimethylargininase
MRIAITRPVSASLARCELTHLERQPIDVDLARDQHQLYEEVLAAAGSTITRLPEEPELPDAVFVEDAAIVFDELAVITRPGAESRRPETRSVAEALVSLRKIATIQAPGTLDGGDVMCVGKMVYVGASSRSNPEGVRQLRALLKPFGYLVQAVTVRGCLHLKSAVTQVAPDSLLVNPDWVDAATWPELRIISVDAQEPHGGNALLIGQSVIYPTAYPKTRASLEAQGIPVIAVDVSELIKAEGAVTCCSLVFEA